MASVWNPTGPALQLFNALGLVATQTFTATEGQTVFNLTEFAYAPNTSSILVFRNGDVVLPSVVVESSSTSFTLAPQSAGTGILVIGFVGITSAPDTQVKVSASDGAGNFLQNKLIAGSNVTILKQLVGEEEFLIISSTGGGGGGADGNELVKVSATDTAAEYLEDKIAVSAPLQLETLFDGALQQQIRISINTSTFVTSTSSITLTGDMRYTGPQTDPASLVTKAQLDALVPPEADLSSVTIYEATTLTSFFTPF